MNKLLAGIGLCAAPDSCQSPKRVSSIDQAGVPPARAGQARSRSCRLLKQPRQRSEDWAGRREAAGCGERACRRKVHAYPARGAHGSDAAGQGGLHCDLVRGLGKGTRNGERKGELAGFVGPEGRARFASGSRPRWRSRSADGPDPADFGPKIARLARWMGEGSTARQLADLLPPPLPLPPLPLLPQPCDPLARAAWSRAFAIEVSTGVQKGNSGMAPMSARVQSLAATTLLTLRRSPTLPAVLQLLCPLLPALSACGLLPTAPVSVAQHEALPATMLRVSIAQAELAG